MKISLLQLINLLLLSNRFSTSAPLATRSLASRSQKISARPHVWIVAALAPSESIRATLYTETTRSSHYKVCNTVHLQWEYIMATIRFLVSSRDSWVCSARPSASLQGRHPVGRLDRLRQARRRNRRHWHIRAQSTHSQQGQDGIPCFQHRFVGRLVGIWLALQTRDSSRSN